MIRPALVRVAEFRLPAAPHLASSDSFFFAGSALSTWNNAEYAGSSQSRVTWERGVLSIAVV